MKILQLVPELNQGGVERGVVEFSREIIRRGHDSYVISSGGKLCRQIELDGGRHIVVNVCSKNPLTVAFRILKLKNEIKKIKPDIVHARSRVPAWMCVFALSQINVSFVTTVHGFNSVSFYSKIMTRGNRVICVSSAVKDYIKENYVTDEEKIRIVHRAVDTEEFSFDKLDKEFIKNFRAEYNLKDKYVVGCVGRISPLKNFETFIEAIRICSDNIENIKGVIVGGCREDKKAYYKKLKEIVKTKNMQDIITFTGSQSKMAEIYSLLDLVVTCSKKPESFGRSLIEAMAMETPVVSPAMGGPLDIIIDNETGILFDSVESSKLADSILKARRTEFFGLRDYVLKKFSLSSMVEKELEVYRELL